MSEKIPFFLKADIDTSAIEESIKEYVQGVLKQDLRSFIKEVIASELERIVINTINDDYLLNVIRPEITKKISHLTEYKINAAAYEVIQKRIKEGLNADPRYIVDILEIAMKTFKDRIRLNDLADATGCATLEISFEDKEPEEIVAKTIEEME